MRKKIVKPIMYLLYIAFYFLWKITAPLAINDAGSDVILSLGFFVVSVRIINNAGKSDDYKLFTLLMGAGVLFHLIGDFTWISYNTLYGEGPNLCHLSSIFFGLKGIVFCIAILMVIMKSTTRWSRIKYGADGFITAALVAYIAWKLFFGSVAFSAFDNNEEKYVLTTFLLIDFILIFLLSIISNINDNNFADKLNYFGILTLCVANLHYYFEYLKGAYTDSSFIDMFWLIAFMLIALSVEYRTENGLTKIKKKNHDTFRHGNNRSASVALKILFLTAIVLSYKNLIVVGTILVLIVVRNAITGFMQTYLVNEYLTDEYRKLNEILEEKVAERTEELKIKNMELSILAEVDELTVLPNRRSFIKKLEQMISTSTKHTFFALMFIDLDRFKSINDWYGHEIGDKLLISASERFKENLGREGFIARLGGDEFVILLDSVKDLNAVVDAANKIIMAFQEPFNIEDSKIISTVSIGISLFPKNGMNASILLRAADAALYISKENGRNCASVYNNTMKKKEKLRLNIESRLYDSIKNNEIEMTLTPIVKSVDSKITAFEVGIIWNNPIIGEMKPKDFYVIAEDSGFSIILGRWVTEKACSAISELIKESDSFLRILIPVSERYFMGSDIVAEIKKNIIRYGISGSNLEIEITENFYPEDKNEMLRKLNELKDLGVGISIANFGNGYASLGRLKTYPSDTIRISTQITSGIVREGDAQLLAEAMISVGRIFGKRIIADGVTNIIQFQLLKQMGCDEMQGQLHGNPANLEDAKMMLKKPI